ncbi:MAG: hypothetical protein HC904_01960 [Blastochloris sp.]|nr:hypothetical protein [Blastochloris sp.]
MLAGGLTLFPQLLGWKIVYGEWFLYSYDGEGFQWWQPKLWEVLFSPYHGLFYWSPGLVLGCVGFLAWAWKEKGWVGWVGLLIMLGMIWVNASWECWWFGHSYGAGPLRVVCFSSCWVGPGCCK